MSDLSNRSHAHYAPSAMQRIELCPASVRATAGIPETQSDYGKDGTEAHDLFAFALKHGYRDARLAYKASYINPNTEYWTHRKDTEKERFDSVQNALDEVYDIVDSYEDAQMFVETRVHFPSQITNECWGTADVAIVVPSMALVYVIDYKHGAGVYVGIKDNMQLGTYACGVLNSIPAAAALDRDMVTVTTVIVQPRAFSPEGTTRSDVQSARYYHEFFRNKIDAAIWASQQPDAPFVPGEKQCKFCPINAACPAREAAALAVVSTTFSSVRDVTRPNLPVIEGMTPARMAFIMSAEVLLDSWLKDVRAEAFKMMRNGVNIPGFKIVEAQPRRRWYDEDESATALMLMSLAGCTEDEVFPRSLINITDADKLVVDAFKKRAPRGQKKTAAEEAKNILAHLTTKESSGNLTVVPDSDARPAVNLAQTAFSNVVLIPAQGT